MALSSISSSDNIDFYRHRTRHRLFAFLRFVIVFYVLYQLVTTMLLSSASIASVSMEPTLHPGERVLVAPVVYGAPVPFTRLRLPAVHPPHRGDLVLLRPAYARPAPWYLQAIAPIVRFVTGQSVHLTPQRANRNENALLVKRVIAVPGDTVELRDDIAYVKPAGTATFTRAARLTGRSYTTSRSAPPSGWTSGLPFSGSGSPLRLGPNQYFVLGDNRSASSDSRAWGPVTASEIVGQVVLRYWPLKRLGLP